MALARFDELTRVREGIDAAAPGVRAPLKIDTVVIKGVNDDELVDLIEYGRTMNAEVRFIEYMDVGGATRWTPGGVVSRARMLARSVGALRDDRAARGRVLGPGRSVPLPDGTVFGIISSTTEPFCRSCDRSRLTADGMWYLCLYATRGTDLRAALRGGASAEELKALIRAGWTSRDDRGAEVRLALGDRRVVSAGDSREIAAAGSASGNAHARRLTDVQPSRVASPFRLFFPDLESSLKETRSLASTGRRRFWDSALVPQNGRFARIGRILFQHRKSLPYN